MYLAYLGVTIPLLQKRREGWPQNLPDAKHGLFSLGRWAMVTNVLAIVYGASMAINLAWPRDEFYGAKWYQQYGPITGVAVVVVGLALLYYGRQQHHGTVLAEHRADGARRNAPAPAGGRLSAGSGGSVRTDDAAPRPAAPAGPARPDGGRRRRRRRRWRCAVLRVGRSSRR